MDRIKGKKALVIGASTGIGRAVCQVFAAEGADVAVGDFGHEEEKRTLLDEIQVIGGNAIAVEVDVRREDQVKAAIDRAIERFGHLDILVNNAGIAGYRGPRQDESAVEWDEVFDVNTRGVFFGIKHILPHMLDRGYGRIINTASQLAHKPQAWNAAYCASKAAVVSLTVSTAYEVATQGITVNAVCPGPTETPMFREGRDEAANRRIEIVPMKRSAQPEEIAWAFVYLASDESAFCTGQSISPNGGDVCW
jgi:NAD(P)-dependent dehydrogenase (short-subunit alcohol dehydrogenase family)